MMNTERRIWLAQEIERTRIESSPAWEGFEVLQEAQLGDVLFRVQPDLFAHPGQAWIRARLPRIRLYAQASTLTIMHAINA